MTRAAERSAPADEAPPTCSHVLLQTLLDLGVDCIFGNLGTDHAPLIEEMARWQQEGRRLPQVVLCPHENVAMHMAMGHAMASGRGQAVLVHVDSGTANAAMAAHNAMRSRVPVLLIAGRAPFTSRGELLGTRDNYVHFIQEPFDQASLVRPYVKWSHHLPSAVVTREVLQRAHSVMMSEPRGPAYLTVARETLAERCDPPPPDSAAAAPQPDATATALRPSGADEAFIDRLAARIEAAERPLLITAYAGRNPHCPALLAALAEQAGLRVVEFNPQHLNLAHDHPCHAGFQPGPLVAEADLGILLDVDVPWIPRDGTPRPDSTWIQIDVDPLKRDLPLWPFPAHERVAADSTLVLGQLLERLRQRADAGHAERARRRVERSAQDVRQRRERAQAAARTPGTAGAINPHYLCALLGEQLDADTIVVNEAIRNTPAVLAQLPRTRPGTLFANGGGGLGYSGGVALGVKLAQPQRTVLQCVGDGSLYFNGPASVFATAQRHGLAMLTVVFDNGGWAAVKDATLSVYPQGSAHRHAEFRSRLGMDVDFAQVARAAGAHGERVVEPDGLRAAIERCRAALGRGQAAVLHVSVTPL